MPFPTTKAYLDTTAEIVTVLNQDGVHLGSPTYSILNTKGELVRNVQDLHPYLETQPLVLHLGNVTDAIHAYSKLLGGYYPDLTVGDFPRNTQSEKWILGSPSCNYGYLVIVKINPSRFNDTWDILVNDHDDGYIRKVYTAQAERDAEWNLICANAPVTFTQLTTSMGFKYD